MTLCGRCWAQCPCARGSRGPCPVPGRSLAGAGAALPGHEPRQPLGLGPSTRGRAAGPLRRCLPCGESRAACQVAGRERRLPAGAAHPRPGSVGICPPGQLPDPAEVRAPALAPRESPAALGAAEPAGPGPDRGGGISAPGLGGSGDAGKVRLQQSLGEKRKDLGLRASAWGSALSRCFRIYQIYSAFGCKICSQRLASFRSNAHFDTALTG